LNGIHVNPSSHQEMRENVEKVLQFVASKKIRMHQTSAKGMCCWAVTTDDFVLKACFCLCFISSR